VTRGLWPTKRKEDKELPIPTFVLVGQKPP
jgi:hypothetical protein